MRLILLACLCLLCSCSTRQVHTNLQGSTEQRLVSYSVDHAMAKLPDADFAALTGKTVYLRCHYLTPGDATDYATRRLELELQQRFQVTLIHSTDGADFVLDFFFNSLGTDHDSFGFELPPLTFPGLTSSVEISLVNLDFYHGVTELYYYISDAANPAKIVRGDHIKHTTKTDRLSTPIIAFPISKIK